MPRQTLSLHHLLSGNRPLVVGTLHEASGLQILGKLAAGAARALPEFPDMPDILEARLDCLSPRRLPSYWPVPVIATARHPDEGGSGNLPQATRRLFLEEAMPWASALDIELRSARSLAPVVAQAHQHGRTVILSHHNFKSTPSLAVLRRLASRAVDQGADLFKVATFLRSPGDLRRLIELQLSSAGLPVAAMGMGPAGRFSRLVLSGFGAPLCYGWLGKPQVAGQWPALRLRELLDEALPS